MAGADLLRDPLGVPAREVAPRTEAWPASWSSADFLGEPTTGLDPQSRSNLWDHIRGLRASLGTTIFLTTHYLDEAAALCDRVLIIDNGRIVAAGSPEELKRASPVMS